MVAHAQTRVLSSRLGGMERPSYLKTLPQSNKTPKPHVQSYISWRANDAERASYLRFYQTGLVSSDDSDIEYELQVEL